MVVCPVLVCAKCEMRSNFLAEFLSVTSWTSRITEGTSFDPFKNTESYLLGFELLTGHYGIFSISSVYMRWI